MKNFQKRMLDYIPPHFTVTELNDVFADHHKDILARWIYQNCYGRFGITKDVVLQKGNAKQILKVGFEEPSDLTLFALLRPAQNISI